MHHDCYCEEGIVKQVIALCVVEGAGEGALSQVEKNDEGDYHIFPPEKYEKVRKTVIEPPTMVQHYSV